MIEKGLLVYTNELLKLQKALTRNNIQAVYLKGIIQHFALTKKWPVKIPVDIDILIPSGSFLKVRQILKSLGYAIHRPYRNPPIRPQISFVKSHVLGPIVCDIHNQAFFPTKYIFNVLPPKLVKQLTAEFLSRAKTISFQNKKFRILGPEDMLLHQSLNFFFHHSCRNPHQIYDIALITKLVNINWEIFLKRLQFWNLKEFVYYPLLLAKNIAKTRIPNLTLEKLKPNKPFSLFASLFINSKTVASPVKNMHLRFRYNIFLRLLISNQSLLKKIQEMFLLIIFPIKRRPKE